MVDKKSLDFLPQTFRTATNRRFLNATMDQLIQEPNMARLYGYIGRQNLSPAYKAGDAYVEEIDSYSQYYQLEPGLVINKRIAGSENFRKENAYNYVDLLNSIALEGGINTDHSRLFAQEYYNFEGFVDLDKLVNYTKYYWMPNGPKTLDVNSGGVPVRDDFNISRPLATDIISNTLINKHVGAVGYSVDNFPNKINPTITLVRGGTYTFNLSQPGHPFYIQTEPGLGTGSFYQENILKREVFGVNNNGTETGQIVFAVPTKNAQNFFETMTVFDTVDIVTDYPFSEIQNAPYDQFVLDNDLDGLKAFETKRIIFTNQSDDFWFNPDNYDDPLFPFDANTVPPDNPSQSAYDRGALVPQEQRKGIWQLNVVDGLIRLTYVKDWPSSTKIFVKEGREYGHTFVFKDTLLQILKVPNVTAPLDVLYYQDGVDPNVYGEIRLIEPDANAAALDVLDIIGRKEYTSPNGVVFTSGLKIKFTGLVEPAEYFEKEFVVEGVGKQISLIAWENLVTPDPNNPNLGDGFSADDQSFDELNYDLSLNAPVRKDYIVINRASIDGNSWSRTNRWFHEDVIRYSLTFTDPLAPVELDNNFRAIRPIVEFDANLQLWNHGNKFVSPVTVIDSYITDVANQVEGRSPYVLVFPNAGNVVYKKTTRDAFINDKQLYFNFVNDLSLDMKVVGSNISPNTSIVDIDYDAKIVTLNNGLLNFIPSGTEVTFNGYFVSDSVPLEDGTQVIFVKEKYANVRNKIYSVKNIIPHSGADETKPVTGFSQLGSNTIKVLSTEDLFINMKVTGPTGLDLDGNVVDVIPANTVIMSIDTVTDTVVLSSRLAADLPVGSSVVFSNKSPQIHLTPIHTMSQGENVVALSGITRQNSVYWWNNDNWQAAQLKFSLNQAPLFDVYNLDGISWGDQNYFASSTFAGSKLFGYKEGTGRRDSELGFPLVYKNIGNIGDIVFENYYDTDKFNFSFNNKDFELEVAKGYVHEINPADMSYKLRNNWVKVNDLSKQYIEKKYVATENRLNNWKIDVSFINSFTEKNIFVYVNGKEIHRDNFTLYGDDKNSELVFAQDLTPGDVLVVRLAGIPQGVKENYTVPVNLVDNSQNEIFDSLTLGQIRNHLQKITYNSLDFRGDASGSSNLRDIDYKVVPGRILQHSAGVHAAQLLFNHEPTDIIKAIDFNRRAYSRFKDRFLYLLKTIEFVDTTNTRECFEDIMEEITLYASSDQSFYYTDMVACGKNKFILNEYPVYDTNYRTFNLIAPFDSTTPTYQAVLVYLNNSLLRINLDYVIDGLVVTINPDLELNIDDVISIYEYSDTRGSMIPATPTKLGLYPKFTPRIFEDDTYIGNPVTVVQGHDGSKTVAFNDYRDNILLELETRIYNNISLTFSNDARTSYTGIEPGAFRKTDYNLDEWTQLLSGPFLSWAGQNNVNVFSNTTVQNDPFSYNYGQGVDKLFGEGVPGYWRAIYKYFYDTDSPHARPWEMLGFTEEPYWWQVRYGPAPYTSGNKVLWDDLEAGLIYGEGSDSYYDARYARPGLSQIIPVNVHGDLLAPVGLIMTNWNQQTAGATWRFGDQSPQETAWRRSSDYPFAVQIAWALARPAQYASLSLNRRDLIRIPELDQIINKNTGNRKLQLLVTDDTQYIPGSNIWIRDRLVDLNLDVNEYFIDVFNYFSLNLLYKASSYTDKSYLQIIADQASPNSTNTGVLLPQENYELVLTKSSPVAIATYSAVIVEKSAVGFAVRGFDNNRPYFTIIPRLYDNNFYNVKVSETSGVIYNTDANTIQTIPYGTQLSTRQQVIDFLISYGRYLSSLGFQFIDTTSIDTIPAVADWTLAVKEFLFWIEQGWDNNTVISLTPAGTKINFDSNFGIVDELTNSFNGSRILDNTGKTLQNKDYTTYRSDTAFELIMRDNTKGIHLVDMTIVQYEHTIVFDNITVFNDVVYEPSLGNRQYRLKVSGFKTRDWNGSLYAPGFMINHKPIEFWQPINDYYKGDIVKYKNQYYTARQFIPGKPKFELSDWYEIKNDLLKRQLIPNLAFNAQQFENFYDVDNFDVNRYADNLSRASTGFVPRNYLTNMGLDNISQHKFYLGMIREKGTQAAVDAFLRAKLPYIENNVVIDEQWAVRLGTYGGTAQKDEIEISLANAKTTNGAYVVEFIDQNSSRNEIWNTYKPSDMLVKPAVYDNSLFDETEPYPKLVDQAGYVVIDEVNVSIFDLRKIYNINQLSYTFGEGSRIWVASDQTNDWTVLRVTAEVSNKVIYSTVVANEIEFNTRLPHGFEINDYVMIRKGTVGTQNTDLSGFYRINSVKSRSFRVDINPLINPTTGTMNAELFFLKPVRYASKAKFALAAPSKGWKINDRVWVDGLNGDWSVLENKSSYTSKETLTPVFSKQADSFGSAIDLKVTQDIMLVGAENKTSKGFVFAYRQLGDGSWGIIEGISPDDEYSEKFGHSLQYNDLDYAVIGAPNSINNTGLAYVAYTTSSRVELVQALYVNSLSTDDLFGTSVSTSKNGKWIAVGAPGADTVYIWKFIEVENSATRSIALNGSLVHDVPAPALGLGLDANDFSVKLNGKLLIPFLDYTCNGTFITLTSVEAWASTTDYSAGSLVTYNDVVYTVTKNFTSGGSFQTNIGSTYAGTVTTGSSGLDYFIISTLSKPEAGGQITIDSTAEVRKIVRVVNNGSTYTIYTNLPVLANVSDSVTFTNRDVLEVSTYTLDIVYDNYYKYITKFTNDVVGSNFGFSVNLNADGTQVSVGAPDITEVIDGITYDKVGSAYVFQRTIETFVADGNTNQFELEVKDLTFFDAGATVFDAETTTFGEFAALSPVVTLDGIVTEDYSFDAQNLILDTVPAKQTLVTVESNNFTLLTEVKSPTKQTNLKFGYTTVICPTTCSLYVGAPGFNKYTKDNGAVYRFLNLAKLYGSIVAQKPNPTFTVGDSIRLNGVRVYFTGTTLTQVVADINAANIPGVTASIFNNRYLRIVSDRMIAFNRLILNRIFGSTVFEDANLPVFAYTQRILAPVDSESYEFGKQITLDKTAEKMIVASDTSSSKVAISFDGGRTTFDRGSTFIMNVYYRAGAAFLYEYQGDDGESATNHGNFTFAQVFADPNLRQNDRYGTAVAISTNWVIISAQNSRLETGVIYTYQNETGAKNWRVVRQKPVQVDARKIDRIYLYNDNTKTVTATLPVIDPEHGIPVPSAAEQIRYVVNYDPAVYNRTPNQFTFAVDPKNAWGEEHVGQLWWDTNLIKYVDWNQGTLLDKFSNWGLAVPNSYINVCEWIESDISPSEYNRTNPTSGTVYTAGDVYTIKTIVDPVSLQSKTKYYFWVKNSSANNVMTRRDSALSLQNLISNPRKITQPFAAVISNNAVALFNCQDIVNNDTRLHITVKKQLDLNSSHEEWSMFDDGTELGVAQEFLDRLNDSMSGEDIQGRTVPDLNLTEKQKYGLSIRPRQTTFADKFNAREVWIDNVNAVLIQHPIILLRDIASLNAYDPEPIVDLTTIKLAVENLTELEFVFKPFYTIGDQALVKFDSETGGWSVRQLSVDPANSTALTWSIVKVQTYDLRKYWTYADWYAQGFNADSSIKKIVNYEYEISEIDLEIGDLVKINFGDNGNWKLVLVKSDSLELIGQQNATIQFTSDLYNNLQAGFGIDSTSFEVTAFARDAAIEFRHIFNIVNNQLLTKELREDYKNIIRVVIDNIATQFKQNDWLLKTSLINIKNRVRKLDQIPVYVKQPDNIVIDFINEVKPFHTKIKQYISSYDQLDLAALNTVDFDLPAYFNSSLNKYRQPQFVQRNGIPVVNPIDDLVADKEIYSAWIGNHTYSIEAIDIFDGGTGYTGDIEVRILGDGVGATAVAYARG